MGQLTMSIKEYLEIKETLDSLIAWIHNAKIDVKRIRKGNPKTTTLKSDIREMLEDFEVVESYADRLVKHLDYHYWQANKE